MSKSKKHFEGWYYKVISKDLKNMYAFIPGISKSFDDKDHCFIQVLDGISSTPYNFKYPINNFEYVTDDTIKINDNIFSKNGIRLNITNDNINISGELLFDNIHDIKRNIFKPTAMGYFEYFTFLECKHEVLSMNHNINGELKINDNIINFNDGKGYIEKDTGESFPKSYVWIQSNHFKDSNISLMCSIANIPFIYKSFNGFICILLIGNKEYRFTTYNMSKIKNLDINGDKANIILKSLNYTLKIHANSIDSASLYSPKNGAMSSHINESMNSEVSFTLYDKHNQILYKDKSILSGVEIVTHN